VLGKLLGNVDAHERHAPSVSVTRKRSQPMKEARA